MARKKEKMLTIRMTEEDLKAFEQYSENVGVPMAVIVRSHIKSLLKRASLDNYE